MLGMVSTFLFGSLLLVSDLGAMDVQAFGKPLSIHGYLSQSVGLGIAGEHYDTQKHFQSAIFQGLLELAYDPAKELRIFLSGKLNADYAYPVLENDRLWQEKGFGESRKRLYILDSTKDLLNEAHITWQKGPICVRLGKQIVRWGETDGFRLMDQINPLDQRRGLADVEFENTILPIWLVRAEYTVPTLPAWLQALSFQGIFNPNVQFRPNASLRPGNNVSGIWSPSANIPLGGPYPLDYAHLGAEDARVDEPTGPRGYDYAFRMKMTLHDTIFTANYYYGRDKDPVSRIAGPSRVDLSPYDGRMIVHPNVEGYYPIFRFAGGTLTTDIDSLQSTCLGGVAPVLRGEAFYAFGSTFTSDAANSFESHDEIRWAVGVDWKVMVPVLNPYSFFTISPQYYHRKIVGYPDRGMLTGPGGGPLRENNYQSSLMVSTSYLNGKLQPSFFWLRNISERADFYRFNLIYDWSHNWRYTVGALLFYGAKEGKSFEAFAHKDQVYLAVSYRF